VTVTFENDDQVLVYALEKIISFARHTHYIFLAESIWLISSIIGLHQELVIQIDKLKIWSEVPSRSVERSSVVGKVIPQTSNITSQAKISQRVRGVSAMPRDIQEESRSNIILWNIHQHRISQVHNTTYELDSDNSQPCDSSQLLRDSKHLPQLIKDSEEFVQYSLRAWKEYNKQNSSLSRSRSGRVPVKLLTKKQQNRLQAIHKDTLAEYLRNRK